MTAKEYLNQARYLNMQINSKLEQISTLKDLSMKCTVSFSQISKTSQSGTSRIENAIIRIVDLENEINNDVNKLIDLKHEIITAINSVDNIHYQIILEKRYLCFNTWEQIANDMNHSVTHIHRIHDKALKKLIFSKKMV